MTDSPFPPDRRANLAALLAECSCLPWRVSAGATHLEVKAAHQTERSVARVYCDIDAAAIVGAVNSLPDALAELEAQDAVIARLTAHLAELQRRDDRWRRAVGMPLERAEELARSEGKS